MKRDPSPAVDKLLEYLQELGFQDLYLKTAGSPLAAESEEVGSELSELAAVAATCEQCDLSVGRNSVVFGTGSPKITTRI